MLQDVMLILWYRSVTEMFKTPGKLRGKTPRTAKKRGQEGRAVRIIPVIDAQLLILLPAII